MSHLVKLIDEYKDAHGAPSDSSIARAIGVAPQTISSWRRRGIKQAPDHETLRALAEFIGKDYKTVVLQAVLLDASLIHPGEVVKVEDEASTAKRKRGAS
jgi:transcriptional regulator with XRE-family HTH domain